MSQELRERIVDAAVRLLETQGPKGFGQVRVAREAGVAQGHLTYYFRRKSDLAAAVVERLTRETRLEMEPLLLGAGDAGGGAEAREQFFVQVLKVLRNDKRSRAMLGLLAEALDDPELAAVLSRHFDLQRAAIARIFGRPMDDPDVHFALAALRGLGMENLLRGEDTARLEALVARFRACLAAPPASPSA
jgi:AcrR family transcriptional regulator